MRKRSSTEVRSDELAELLRNGKREKRNGNQRIAISPGLRLPGVLLCQRCPLALRCLAGPQLSVWQAHDEHRRCAYKQERAIINFYYHATNALTVDLANRRLTDNYEYGHSMTTTCNIRKYLNAIADNFPEFNLGPTRIDEIMKIFKKAKEKTWVNV